MNQRLGGTLTEIPDLELDVVVLHRLHVEPNRCSNATTTTSTSTHVTKPAEQNRIEEKNAGIGSGEPTWDRGDDLPHLQPICEKKKKHKHPDQIRGGDGEITSDGVGGRGGLT